jgi:hypothetical protein
MDITPLSQLFFFTDRKPFPEFSAVDWLSKVDDAVVERVIQSSEDFFEGVNANSDNVSFESVDYLTLCYMMAEEELQTDSSQLSDKEKENCLKGMAMFAVYEKLRRKGLVSFCGVGKVSEYDQKVEEIKLTEMGKVVGSSIKTMMDLSEMLVEE